MKAWLCGCAHRRRRDRHAKALQFANNALIAPPRVVSRQTEGQRSDLSADRRTTSPMSVGPPLPDQAPMLGSRHRDVHAVAAGSGPMTVLTRPDRA